VGGGRSFRGRSFTQDEYAKVLELIAASAKASRMPPCYAMGGQLTCYAQVPGSKENTEALQDLNGLFHHTV